MFTAAPPAKTGGAPPLLPILLPALACQDLLPAEMDAAAYGSTSTRRLVDDLTQTGNPPTQGARYFRIKVVPCPALQKHK